MEKNRTAVRMFGEHEIYISVGHPAARSYIRHDISHISLNHRTVIFRPSVAGFSRSMKATPALGVRLYIDQISGTDGFEIHMDG